jgi:hypothetical protein
VDKGSAAENEVRIVVLHARQGDCCYRLYDNNVCEAGHDDEVGSWPFQMGQMRTRAQSSARLYAWRYGRACGMSTPVNLPHQETGPRRRSRLCSFSYGMVRYLRGFS